MDAVVEARPAEATPGGAPDEPEQLPDSDEED